MANAIGVIAVIIVGLLALGFVASLFEDPSDCTSSAAQGYAMAFTQDHARPRLFAPHTADFDLVSAKVRNRASTQSVRHHVEMTVSSKNVFGGPAWHQIKAVFSCRPKNDDREWRLVSFDMW